MATLKQIRGGLKDRLATVQVDTQNLLRAYDYVPGQVEPPAALVRPETLLYDTSQAALTHDPTFVILVLVSVANDRAAQDKLDALIDPGAGAILAAIDAAPTLGGVASYAVVTFLRNYGLITYAGVEYLGAELVVQVGMG